MRGTRCWQIAVLTTGVNLFLSFTLVMYSFSHTGVHSPPGDPRALLSLEYTGEEGVQAEAETKPSQPALAAVIQDAPAKLENLTPENLNPENLNPENLNKEYAPLNQHSETQEEFTIQYKPGEGVFDQFRMFKVFDFSKTGENWLQLGKRHICLGAQTSVDRIYHLVELLGGWTGQLSLAIFTPDLELSVAHKYIQFLSHCYPNLHQQVSFHLVEPVDHPGVLNMDIFNEIHETQVKCEDHKIYLDQLMSYLPKNMSTWRVSYPYPQNLLRNTAKRTCQTEYTYIPDIDMVLPAGIDMQLEKFIETQEKCKKCAYVVPTYEIKSDLTSTPKNKNELRELVNAGKAQQFHLKLYSINQKASNLKQWEKLEDEEEMKIAYKVEKYIFKYEPLYISKGDTPLFDERFIGFGMTRNTQVYEMFVAGYEFHVLNNAFTYHWGFQSLKSRPYWRSQQQTKNNKKFDNFALELIARYGKDPYNMKDKLPKLNLGNIQIGYGYKEKPSL